MPPRLILKTKAVLSTAGEPFTGWAAYAEGAARTDSPVVYSWATTEAKAQDEFNVYASAFALTGGCTLKAADALLGFRLG